MRRLFQNRFQLQLLFAFIAAVSVAGLTVDLVWNAIQHAESFVLADTHRALDHAIQELHREYNLRRRGDSSWAGLPAAAQDISLRAISQTVLGSYPGVEGGFWTSSQFLGYSYPTHDVGSLKIDVPAAERTAIEEAIAGAREHRRGTRILRGKHDLVVISAVAAGPMAAWAMKRLPGQAEPAQRTRSLLAAALVGMAFLGAAGVFATGIGLRRGVAQITSRLEAIDKNFEPALPMRHDELGEISAAINEMAKTRRRLEAELRREERTSAIGHLIGRIAHEMRNPLNSIRLSLQMLAHRHDENRLKREDFGIVIDEVDRMNGLLSDLLAFQQPRPPRLEHHTIATILQDATQLVWPQAEKAGVRIVVEEQSPRTALLDAQYCRQILVNLLLNAVEVSAPGTTIAVRAFLVDGRMTIQVSDNGPGITREQQEHLFEPFYTTKASGHGLGLAVSRELARSMGGDLVYEQEDAAGATFVLQLKGTHGA